MSDYKLNALSLRQPWAWLAVMGLKQYETRSWKMKYRGVMAIHAAQGFGELELTAIRSSKAMVKTLNEHGIHGGNIKKRLAFGAVVGLVDIVDIFPAGRIAVSDTERAFGNFTEGRYAWMMRHAVMLETPIPVIGRQGLFSWYVPDGAMHQVRMAVERMESNG